MTDSFKGNIFIVAAPSGGGKTSLVRELIVRLTDIELSVSHTTRNARPGEQDGRDYFFVSEKQFTDMMEEGAFVEQAYVFTHYYGTSFSQINERLNAGIDVVLDIDWQGAAQMRRLYPDAITIFIVPPSLAVLKKRLQDRRQDNALIISQRMQQAQDEMSHYPEFDFLIVNDDFSKASEDLQAIVLSNRLITARQVRKNRNLLSLLLSSK